MSRQQPIGTFHRDNCMITRLIVRIGYKREHFAAKEPGSTCLRLNAKRAKPFGHLVRTKRTGVGAKDRPGMDGFGVFAARSETFFEFVTQSIESHLEKQLAERENNAGEQEDVVVGAGTSLLRTFSFGRLRSGGSVRYSRR